MCHVCCPSPFRLLPPVLQAIKASSRDLLHVDGICTFCEMAVPLVSRLAEALGLPGNTPAAVDAARDKVGALTSICLPVVCMAHGAAHGTHLGHAVFAKAVQQDKPYMGCTPWGERACTFCRLWVGVTWCKMCHVESLATVWRRACDRQRPAVERASHGLCTVASRRSDSLQQHVCTASAAG